MNDCIFCKIINSEIPSYKIYEDGDFLAILDIYPSVKGQTVIIPKKHIDSYVFNMKSKDYQKFMAFTKKTAKLIDSRLDSLRTCMVMEGMEIDHAHIKLYPVYTIGKHIATETFDMNIYPGYLTTLHGEKASDIELKAVVKAFSKKDK
jgi:histidine triad (HIT) family protein